MSYNWLPKSLDGTRELQADNGLLNTPDSCQHTRSEVQGEMIITHADTKQRLNVCSCCVTLGVIQAARMMRAKGTFRVRPAPKWEAWFSAHEVVLAEVPGPEVPASRNRKA